MNDRLRFAAVRKALARRVGETSPLRRRAAWLLLAAWVSLLAGSAWAAPPPDLPDRLVVRLPDGGELAFRAVYLGVGSDKLFAARQVQLGSREGKHGYKAQLTETLLSGSFVGTRNSRPDWLYYVGETEVQQGQWAAVLRHAHKENVPAQQAGGDPKLPVTAVTVSEIYAFLEALNQWLLSHEQASLPRFRGAPAFCRLPTEAEWEFAARGGVATLDADRSLYDAPHPYGDDPMRHEWLQNNAGRKLHACGSPDIQPNPLGIRDMLGNAQELTLNLFSPDYQQGRFGDFVIRGTDYTHAEPSASLRNEHLAHDKDGAPYRAPRLGFRLVLGTRISAMQVTADEMDGAFAEYRKTLGLTQPGPSASSSPAAQAEQDKERFLKERQERDRAAMTLQAGQISTLEQELAAQKATLFQLEQTNRTLQGQLEQKTQALQEAGQSRHAFAGTAHSAATQERIEQLEALNRQLSADNSELVTRAQSEASRNFVSSQANNAFAERLKERDGEIADLKRRAAMFDHEIEKNAGRVRAVEKLYLEALLRQASANALFGYRNLKNLELAVQVKRLSKADAAYGSRYNEAALMVRDLCDLVRQIVSHTQDTLFPEVKRELWQWLQDREKAGDAGLQRHSLDLIERYVHDARAGLYRQPDALIAVFTSEPEFQIQ
ncbi:SUMF1/EgtB/PvdO family nonheme iron enzyme [Solidesulfovibrio sp.]|uniref:SUMF1/EgtB/PvdO family nonheme iron enzyme n=1 Tax=Solidesulfovibrio sp. TaxID=2910990 RepID=UPI00261E7532|nr:SUMF1/EgtB/PvdO family nonheme iron enzyme [Solidesulfovibrio sp.]